MCNATTELTDKIDLAPWGYAPGTTNVSCMDCLDEGLALSTFYGHRFAIRCPTHALRQKQKQDRWASLLAPDMPDEEIIEAILQLPASNRLSQLTAIGCVIGIIGVVALALFGPLILPL